MKLIPLVSPFSSTTRPVVLVDERFCPSAAVPDTMFGGENGLITESNLKLGVCWYEAMIFAGGVTRAHTQTKSNVCFFLWLTRPAPDRRGENPPVRCVLALTLDYRGISPHHCLTVRNRWGDSHGTLSWFSVPSDVWSAAIRPEEWEGSRGPGSTYGPHLASRLSDPEYLKSRFCCDDQLESNRSN